MLGLARHRPLNVITVPSTSSLGTDPVIFRGTVLVQMAGSGGRP